MPTICQNWSAGRISYSANERRQFWRIERASYDHSHLSKASPVWPETALASPELTPSICALADGGRPAVPTSGAPSVFVQFDKRGQWRTQNWTMVESANFIPQFRLRVSFMRETTKREKHTHTREIQTLCFRRAPRIACPLILASARVSCSLVCFSMTRDFSLYTSNLELFRLDFPASLSNPRLN